LQLPFSVRELPVLFGRHVEAGASMVRLRECARRLVR
jgi:hypothetical protein